MFTTTGHPGGYAFISHTPRLRYATRNPPCVTRTLGHLFMKAGFGLAFEKKSAYTEVFNLEILKLRQAGFIEELDRKWITGKCPDPMLGKALGQYTIACIIIIIIPLILFFQPLLLRITQGPKRDILEIKSTSTHLVKTLPKKEFKETRPPSYMYNKFIQVLIFCRVSCRSNKRSVGFWGDGRNILDICRVYCSSISGSHPGMLLCSKH